MAGKISGKSSKKFITKEIEAAKIQLVNTNKLNIALIRRHLGLEGDDRDPKTFDDTSDYIKELRKKLKKAKNERDKLGK